MKLNCAGITRSKKYSPNHELNDSLIISKTTDQLRKLGCEVEMFDEDSFDETVIRSKVIFSMVRGMEGIRKLDKLSQKGYLVFNHPQSVLNCYRYNLINYFDKYGIPYPKSILVETAKELDGQLNNFSNDKIWIKRSDVHSIQKEDVVWVEASIPEVKRTLKEFGSRKIESVILQEHIYGDSVKFYAVAGTDFFHWYYTDNDYKTEFDVNKLKTIAGNAASLLNLYIYGGDAIILPGGEIILVDLNDWPSYAPIRDEASYNIAKLIYEKGNAFIERKNTSPDNFIYNSGSNPIR